MKTPFVILQAHQDDFHRLSQNAVNNIQSDSILSKVFFSPENVNLINRQIIKTVYRLTNKNYIIDPQDPEDLKVVMRSVFNQHASGHCVINSIENLDRSKIQTVRKIISSLNEKVIEEIIPGIMSEVKAYGRYLQSVFGPTQVMDRPKNVSNSGRKSLPSVTSLFSM